MVSEGRQKRKTRIVLILVVVEYGLGEGTKVTTNTFGICLNPCCGGIWSRSERFGESRLMIQSLNPCCGGIWSRRKQLLLMLKLLS